jgi:hypothetical protein
VWFFSLHRFRFILVQVAALARYGAIDRSVVFGSGAYGVVRQASTRLECMFPRRNRCLCVLLVNYRISHGTVLLGLRVSQENGGVALEKNFKDGELRYACNIAHQRRSSCKDMLRRGSHRFGSSSARSSATARFCRCHSVSRFSEKVEWWDRGWDEELLRAVVTPSTPWRRGSASGHPCLPVRLQNAAYVEAILGADSTMRAVLCVPQAFVTAAAAKFRAVVEHHFHDSSIDAAAARRR